MLFTHGGKSCNINRFNHFPKMAMQTLNIDLPDNLAALLDQACLEAGHPKQQVIYALIKEYIEDMRDAREAAEIIAEGGPTLSLEEIERKYGLAD